MSPVKKEKFITIQSANNKDLNNCKSFDFHVKWICFQTKVFILFHVNVCNPQQFSFMTQIFLSIFGLGMDIKADPKKNMLRKNSSLEECQPLPPSVQLMVEQALDELRRETSHISVQHEKVPFNTKDNL